MVNGPYSSLGATTAHRTSRLRWEPKLRKKKRKSARRLVPNRPGTHPRVCVSAGEVLTDQDHACVRDNPGLDGARFRGRAHAWGAGVDGIPPQLAGAVQRARHLGHNLVIGENEDGLVVVVI